MHGAAHSVDLEVCTQGDSENGPAAPAPEPAPVTETSPAPVSEPAAPQPLITPAEAQTLLALAQNLLPDSAAGYSLFTYCESLTAGLELDENFWQAFSEVCAKPVEVPVKEPYSYRSFPHADPNAREETKRSQARQGRNQILKAKDFPALAAALRRLNPAQRAWVASQLFPLEDRQNLWELTRSWCEAKLNPQLKLF